MLVLLACSSNPAATACTPGAQVACACPGGSGGIQVCAADGSGLGTCACPDAAAPDVLVDAPATVDAGDAALEAAADVIAEVAVDAPGDTGPETPACVDRDGDGHGTGCAAGLDCDDANPRRYVGAPELCNGVDENCDGLADGAPTMLGGLTFEPAAGMGCVAAFPPPSNELWQPVRCVLPTFDGASWVCRDRPPIAICVMCVRGETGCQVARNAMDGLKAGPMCRQ